MPQIIHQLTDAAAAAQAFAKFGPFLPRIFLFHCAIGPVLLWLTSVSMLKARGGMYQGSR